MTSKAMSGTPASAVTTAAANNKLRGFAVRFGVAAGLLIVLGACLLWLRWGLIVLVSAFAALGAHELSAAAAHRGARPVWQVVAVGTPILLVVEYGGWFGPVLPVGLVGCAVLVLVCWAWRLRGPVEGFVVDAATSVLVVAYLPLLLTFPIAMLKTPHPVAQVATYVACIVLGDSGAYIVGSLVGSHKMTPKISPGKTWEGFAGAVVLAAVVGALFVRFALLGTWWQGIVLGAVLAVCGALGDLVESAMKRDVGVKDMGKLLPGHGGAMDRLDSLLFCAPIGWAMMNLWIA